MGKSFFKWCTYMLVEIMFCLAMLSVNGTCIDGYGAIQVSSDTNITVYLDDAEIGVTPVFFKNIPVGVHTISICDSSCIRNANASIKKYMGDIDKIAKGDKAVIRLAMLSDKKERQIKAKWNYVLPNINFKPNTNIADMQDYIIEKYGLEAGYLELKIKGCEKGTKKIWVKKDEILKIRIKYDKFAKKKEVTSKFIETIPWQYFIDIELDYGKTK